MNFGGIRLHQRFAVHHAARQNGGKLRLRPFDDADCETVHQETRYGRAPDDLVDDAVGPVRAVAEAVAVQIERAVVTPIVAVSALAPVEKARADVFDLAFVVDEGIVVQGRAFDGGGKVYADLAVFKMIGEKFIVVGIIGKYALACLVDNVVVNIGIVDIVEHNALIAAADGDIVEYFEPLGKHQHIAHIVAHGNIAADFAVVGVHIVDGETQIAEAVVFVGVVRAGIGKNAVPPFGNVVANDLRTGCVPNGNAVAALVHAQSRVADDFILAHHRIGRTMQIDADRIIQNIVVFNQGARGSFFEINTGIHCGQAHTGTGNGQVAERYVRRVYGYGAAAPVPFDGCGTVGRPFNRNRFVDIKFGLIYAGSQFKRIARPGAGKCGIPISIIGS